MHYINKSGLPFLFRETTLYFLSPATQQKAHCCFYVATWHLSRFELVPASACPALSTCIMPLLSWNSLHFYSFFGYAAICIHETLLCTTIACHNNCIVGNFHHIYWCWCKQKLSLFDSNSKANRNTAVLKSKQVWNKANFLYHFASSAPQVRQNRKVVLKAMLKIFYSIGIKTYYRTSLISIIYSQYTGTLPKYIKITVLVIMWNTLFNIVNWRAA